jgi:hypothetical protein
MISLPKGRYTWVIFTVVFLSLFGFTLSVSADDALEVLQQATIEKLETIESTVDAVLDKVENRTRSSDLKADIQENKEEIDELMEQQSQAIQDADSIQEVKELVIETAQRIILKTYDGITGEEGLDDVVQIDGTPAQKAEAVDVALKSMVDEETGTYTIQLTTKASFDEAVKRLKLFDDTVEGVLLFDTDGVVTIEVTIDENSILSQEVLTDLEYGQVPDALVGFRINKPEVFRIEEIDLE